MDQFVGEIRIVAFNFAPTGWALCEGQILPLSQNTALFSLLGTTYGGDGKSTFALPNLAGRMPIGAGWGQGLSARDPGEQGGSATVTLTIPELPTHTHVVAGHAGAGNKSTASGATWAMPRYGRRQTDAYSPTADGKEMAMTALSPSGSSQPHNNMPPYLAMNFIIALQGVFPPRQ
ncbi:phage tail protein [Ruicaihuangia caeni]|uniref:Tail fiber protein n=1 Tax=Ruicaihuangia caeni TaxID=3042517 RepID=A0AAW6TAA5_9MICO|nr:tail fiber protein [Klugiella sp. YN-L-19]MDI2098995.1 tail fiber protein [Klugiella sp. YN-L-19]